MHHRLYKYQMLLQWHLQNLWKILFRTKECEMHMLVICIKLSLRYFCNTLDINKSFAFLDVFVNHLIDSWCSSLMWIYQMAWRKCSIRNCWWNQWCWKVKRISFKSKWKSRIEFCFDFCKWSKRSNYTLWVCQQSSQLILKC